MTPFHQPADGTPKSRFNEAYIEDRNSVERCIGLLKTRFRCLLKERVARYAQFVAAIVNSCAQYYKICALTIMSILVRLNLMKNVHPMVTLESIMFS